MDGNVSNPNPGNPAPPRLSFKPSPAVMRRRAQPRPGAPPVAGFRQEGEEDEAMDADVVTAVRQQQHDHQQQFPQQQHYLEQSAEGRKGEAAGMPAAAAAAAPAPASEAEELAGRLQGMEVVPTSVPERSRAAAPSTATAAVASGSKEAQAHALKERGNALAEAGDMAKALEAFEQAIGVLSSTTTLAGAAVGSDRARGANDERSAVLFELKAQVHAALEDYFEAVKASTRAVELAPGWVDAKLTLGRSLLQFGEVRAAVKVLSEICGKNPDNEDVRQDLIYANEVLAELKRREEDFDKQLAGRAGLDAKELEVCSCKRGLLARGKEVNSDCSLAVSDDDEDEGEGEAGRGGRAHEDEEGNRAGRAVAAMAVAGVGRRGERPPMPGQGGDQRITAMEEEEEDESSDVDDSYFDEG